MRVATAKYATNLGRAKADGYQILTMMMPNMGYHFINPNIQGFNIRKPPILVYEHTGRNTWQLGALEWVFTAMPKTPPLPNATFGFFPAACHYKDGTFVVDENSATCPKKAPHTGAKFNFWHPGPDHDARVGLVPESCWLVLEHEPAGRSVQRQLNHRLRQGGRPLRGRPPCLSNGRAARQGSRRSSTAAPGAYCAADLRGARAGVGWHAGTAAGGCPGNCSGTAPELLRQP